MYVKSHNNNWWYSLFFIIFYYFSVLIALNIMIAFTIDMYASVERLDIERHQTIEIIKQEMENEDEDNASDGQCESFVDMGANHTQEFEEANIL